MGGESFAEGEFVLSIRRLGHGVIVLQPHQNETPAKRLVSEQKAPAMNFPLWRSYDLTRVGRQEKTGNSGYIA
jgi:hypothetical protein